MNCEEHKNEELAHCPACLANYWKGQYLMAKNDIEAAVLAERERCKAVLMAAHELSKNHHNYYHYMALQLDETAKAAAIRARGKK